MSDVRYLSQFNAQNKTAIQEKEYEQMLRRQPSEKYPFSAVHLETVCDDLQWLSGGFRVMPFTVPLLFTHQTHTA